MKTIERSWADPSFKSEIKRAIIFLLILFFVQLFAYILPAWSNHNVVRYYLSLHTLLELISIVISGMVFIVGWNSYGERLVGNVALLSCAFFFIGGLDFFHTVSYVGMPDFISSNDSQKHIYFWLLSRLLAAIVLLIVSVRGWKPIDPFISRNFIFISLSVFVSAFIWSLLFHQEWFPTVFIEGQGLTDFKKKFEYIIIAINVASAAVLLTKIAQPQTFNIVLLFQVVCVMAMSEFFFTLYSTMQGSYNMLGHIYKVIAYLLVYRAIVVDVIEEPYKKLKKTEQLLVQINGELEERIIVRTEDLKQANNTLEKTNVELKRVQNDLIQNEKIAALGSLVAGVSHELNTPLGNAVLMSSSLINQLDQLKIILQHDSLRRSDLTNWQRAAGEMAQLCDQSINRAATLITSFKQVAIDQISERRRIFDLRDNVEATLAILRPEFKNLPWAISNEIPAGIECNSFPGSLAQVIVNLIQNAVLHAFEGRLQGHIVIAARVENGNVDMTVDDDGIGMNTTTLSHIFDPFFTTKLGKGGSGLGLAICHRITTSVLAGNISVNSILGSGTRFLVSLPQCPPGEL